MPEGLAEILRAGRATTAGAPLAVAPAVLAGIAIAAVPAMMAGIEIGHLTADRLSEAAALLARAFHEDPGHVHLYPDATARARALPHQFSAACREAMGLSHVRTASVGGRLVGIAVWLPPGAYPISIWRQLRLVPDVARMCLASPRSFGKVVRFAAAAHMAHPAQPYWYLQVIGVEPALQGRGIGTRLVGPVLDMADRAGQPCYLETDTAPNVRWYRGLGFEVRAAGVEFIAGGPPYWTMLRPPPR